jgi:hypothetical protein
VHPEQPPVHADQFHVPHDPLELLYVPVLVLVVHGGHGVDIAVRTPLPFLQHYCYVTTLMLGLPFPINKTTVK